MAKRGRIKGKKYGSYKLSLKRVINTSMRQFKQIPKRQLAKYKKSISTLGKEQQKELIREYKKLYWNYTTKPHGLVVLETIKEQLDAKYFKTLTEREKIMIKSYLTIDLENDKTNSKWALHYLDQIMENNNKESITEFFEIAKEFSRDELMDFEEFYNTNIADLNNTFYYEFIKQGNWDALKELLEIWRTYGESANSWNQMQDWMGVKYGKRI